MRVYHLPQEAWFPSWHTSGRWVCAELGELSRRTLLPVLSALRICPFFTNRGSRGPDAASRGTKVPATPLPGRRAKGRRGTAPGSPALGPHTQSNPPRGGNGRRYPPRPLRRRGAGKAGHSHGGGRGPTSAAGWGLAEHSHHSKGWLAICSAEHRGGLRDCCCTKAKA